MQLFKEIAFESGLKLRDDKSWTASSELVKEEGVNVLGSHIGAKQSQFLSGWLADFAEQIKRLGLLRAQDAMIILRRSMIPQMNNLMRTLELSKADWEQVDEVLIDFVKLFASKPGSKGELDELCLTLPIRFGGLGINYSSNF